MSDREIKSAPTTRIALLGCGTVGSEVARQLLGGRLDNVELVKILVRRAELDRVLPRQLFTTSLEEIFASRPDIVIELVGGLEPATDLIRSALTRGKHVITANKTVIAHHGDDLLAFARSKSTTLSYNAAVGASLPLLATLSRLRGDRVRSIRAVINGTCNFILTRMAATGCGLDAAVSLAQSLGLAEPDPTADISGRDSVEKLVVLARQAGLPDIDLASVSVEGITSITPEDHREARNRGQVIKLLAELEWHGHPAHESHGLPARAPTATLRVGPALLPVTHPLAQLAAEENGALITTELAGNIFLKGKGAGPKPTAAAILGDVCELACRHNDSPAAPSPRNPEAPKQSIPVLRRHAIRVAAHPASLSVDHVLNSSRAARLDELTLSRGRARLLTAPSTSHAAESIATALGGRSLVLPVIEP